jgi:hypothetical protein
MAPFEHTIQVSENYCPYLWRGQITYIRGVCTRNLFLKNEKDVMPTFRCKILPTFPPHDLHIVHEHISLILCNGWSPNVKNIPKTWCMRFNYYLGLHHFFWIKPKGGQHSKVIFHILHIKLI